MIYFVSNLEAKKVVNEESSHLISTRVQPGQTVTAMNGVGIVATLRITVVDKKNRTIHFEIIEKKQTPQPPKRVLLQAKTDKRYLEKMAEVAPISGISEIIIVTTDFSETQQPLQLQRLQAIITRSCEQCHQSFIPSLKIAHTQNLQEILQTYNPIILDASGLDFNQLQKSQLTNALQRPFFVGPEGGFSEKEMQLFLEEKSTICKIGSSVLPSWLAGYTFASACSVLH